MLTIDRIKRLIQFLPHCFALAGRDSVLNTTGWMLSKRRREPLNREGQPIPWITYPSLSFLEPRIQRQMTVFEYGTGASTLWWSQRVDQVVACEHDRAWYERTRSMTPANVQLTLAPLADQQYAREILKYNRAFDVVVIDGRDRVRCALNCVGALRESGVVIWDNSDRQEYQPGYDFLVENGFRRIDFWGMGPINTYGWCTSIFYRAHNCLNI